MIPNRRLVAVSSLAALVLVACGTSAAPSSESDKDPETGVKTAVSSTQWTYQDSLSVALPKDRHTRPLPACARQPLPTGWVARENALPGSPGWDAISHDQNPTVSIYLDSTSTYCGEPVGVHLSTSAVGQITVRAYRIGWYGGVGARLVWASQPVAVPDLPPGPSTPTHLVSPGWPAELRLPVTRTWTPGVYLIEAVIDGVPSGAAPLIVDSGTVNGPYLMVHSSLTWAAYSQFGGTSLYRGPGGRDHRALATDLARPTTSVGLHQLLWNEIPLAQFTERLGLAVDHVTDLNVDAQPSLLLHHTTIILPGHSEYWTTRMYDAITVARNSGVNIADLGANEIYWHTRVHWAGDQPVTMTVARTLAQDALAAAQPQDATVEWRMAPLNRDPTAVIGQGYGAVGIRGSAVVLSLPPWLATDTGLGIGSVMHGLLGNEGDGARANAPGTPPNLQVLIAGVVKRKGFADQAITTTYYSAPSGAGVFAAGITYWTCNLNDACPAGWGADEQTRFALRTLTANLLAAFAQPRAGLQHPSTRFIPKSAKALERSLPKEAIGVYGPGA